MAIIVSEEGERKVDVANLVVWIFLLAAVGIAVYLIFFRRPELVEVVSPSSYRNIDPLAQTPVNPDEISSSPDFRARTQYVPVLPPASVGRSNPFLTP